MNVRLSIVGLAVAILVIASIASAHHSLTVEFDITRTVTLTGSITEMKWTNPHAWLYIDVKDESGNVVNWDCELGPPNGLMRQGWNRNSLQAGQIVTINGFLSKEVAHVANARSVFSYIASVGAMSSTATRSTASGWSAASRCDTRAPRSCPTSAKRGWPSARITATMSAAIARFAYAACVASEAGFDESP